MNTFQDQINDLKSRRVIPFTRSDEFNKELESLFEDIRAQVAVNQQQYAGDWAWTGLAGLVFGVVRKAGRLWDIFIENKAGKDKLDDEFEDNLMIAVYAVLYYRMLR